MEWSEIDISKVATFKANDNLIHDNHVPLLASWVGKDLDIELGDVSETELHCLS